jgi:uncharacterized protein YdgA (DUF945 family)
MTTVTIVKNEDALQALYWAKENCPSYITNDMHMNGYNTYDVTKLDFHFSEAEDALMFRLKWQ